MTHRVTLWCGPQMSNEHSGSATFLPQPFSTPVDHSIRGNLRAEDKPTLWKFLPKIARAAQIAGPASRGGRGSGLFVARQLSFMVGIFSLSKFFHCRTADFLLCPTLPFWFPREWQPHPSTGHFFGSSRRNAHAAVYSCLAVTSALTSLLFPYQVLPWVVKNANFKGSKTLRFLSLSQMTCQSHFWTSC